MFLNSIDKKPLRKNPDGEVIRDLTKSMFDFKANNVISPQAYKVPKEYEMRIDLVSQAMYNNTIYTEFILKYNGISNPFSLDEGEVILVPNLDSAKQNVKIQGQDADSDGADNIRNSYKYIDPTKKPERDQDLEDFENRKQRINNLQPGALPPNISDEGTSQVSVRNGRVFFGEGIGQSACLRNGMSSSEFIAKVIKSRKP